MHIKTRQRDAWTVCSTPYIHTVGLHGFICVRVRKIQGRIMDDFSIHIWIGICCISILSFFIVLVCIWMSMIRWWNINVCIVFLIYLIKCSNIVRAMNKRMEFTCNWFDEFKCLPKWWIMMICIEQISQKQNSNFELVRTDGIGVYRLSDCTRFLIELLHLQTRRRQNSYCETTI